MGSPIPVGNGPFAIAITPLNPQVQQTTALIADGQALIDAAQSIIDQLSV